MNKLLTILIGYALAMLVTYGHAYNTRPDTYQWGGQTLTNGPGDKAVSAFAISIFWPLYLSTIAWEGAKK